MLLQRHQRLLAIELTAVVDEFQRLCPSFCDDPIFSEAWESFAASPPGLLAEALAEPAMEAWVGRARALLASPAMRSCPTQHVPRTLARFSALMINFAGWKGSFLEGTSLVLGGESIPALRGTAQVRPPTARRCIVHWRWSDRLMLHDESGHLLADLSAAEEPSTDGGGTWSVEKARQVGGGIQVFSQPRCVPHQEEEARAELSHAFGEACRALSPTVQGILARATRAAAPGCSLHPLEATSFHTLPASPTPAAVARDLALGLVERCARVYRFDKGSRLEEAVALGTKEELVVMVAHELLGDDEPRSVLDRMLAVCEKGKPVRGSALPERERGELLDLRPAVARAGLTSTDGDRWCEVKSRDPRVAPSWRLNDAMLGLASGDLERLRAVLVTWPEQEFKSFGLACLDYHRGHFTKAVGHLLGCLEADDVCEDYWLLLAFCLRHLRHLELFEEIVFRGSRADSILDHARECL